jgi:hypothetical protein
MSLVVRKLPADIEVSFLQDDSVPEELKDWWSLTRENLERMRDRLNAQSIELEEVLSRLEEAESKLETL